VHVVSECGIMTIVVIPRSSIGICWIMARRCIPPLTIVVIGIIARVILIDVIDGIVLIEKFLEGS
jgi:hypothetical protein